MKYSKEKEQFQKIFGGILKRKYKCIKSVNVDDEDNETKQRQIIFIDMEIQLTPEEKKSLSQYFIYIRSFGSTTANATTIGNHIFYKLKA